MKIDLSSTKAAVIFFPLTMAGCVAPLAPLGADGEPAYTLGETATQTLGVATEAADAFSEGLTSGSTTGAIVLTILAIYKAWMVRKAKQDALVAAAQEKINEGGTSTS